VDNNGHLTGVRFFSVYFFTFKPACKYSSIRLTQQRAQTALAAGTSKISLCHTAHKKFPVLQARLPFPNSVHPQRPTRRPGAIRTICCLINQVVSGIFLEQNTFGSVKKISERQLNE
jgi:hypothetical protein